MDERVNGDNAVYAQGFYNWGPELVESLRQGHVHVLVSVAKVQGSTPRDEGARMWVAPHRVVDTIGGGHLEWKAIEYARRLLADMALPARTVVRYPLGPSLGQCCGGVVWMVFERLHGIDAQWCSTVLQALEEGNAPVREVLFDPNLARAVRVLPSDAGGDASPDRSGPLDAALTCWRDRFEPPSAHIVLCGAGHVGQAIARLLGDLPVTVTWLDARDDNWPSSIARNIRCLQGDAHDVKDMPDDAIWLILTHNHDLDLSLVDAVLRDKPFRYLGVIGSATKRAKFRARLLQRHPAEKVARMVCPIGMAQASSKLPAAIAISTLAQLLPLILKA